MADRKRASTKRSASRRTTRKKPKKNLWLRVLGWTGVGVVVLGLLGVTGVMIAYATVKVPNPNEDFKTNNTSVYYNDGESLLGTFKVQNRVSVAFDDMNQYAKDAIVAAENQTFWTDPGFDPAALVRATLSFFSSEQTVGGSTLTQQYIKVMYLTQEKSLTRKAKEILLAIKMGQEVPKEKILENYLNTVYFGRGAYGLEAASQTYFGKPQSELTMPEAVALVDIVNSPGNLDPAVSENAAADLLERYQYTLNAMVDTGTLTSAERSEAYDSLPEFPKVKKDSAKGGTKGFLLEMVETELREAGFSETQINGGGLTVITTFDKEAQEAVVDVAESYAKEIGGKNADDIHPGIASIDNETGGVIALYGGPDYTENYINWATTPRPTGSTFKPYALTAALRQGWTLNDTVNGNSVTPPGESKPVSGGSGWVTLLSATTRSINAAYVDLVIKLENGHDSVVEAAEDAGVPYDDSWDETGYRIPLGTGEISPLDQAAGYSTFANGGVQRETHVVSQVLDSHGQELYQASTEGKRTIDADVAKDVTYALTKVAQDGTGYRASQLGYPVAGKTGSYYVTEERETRAVWFVGFTQQITTAVMVVKGDQGTGDLGRYFYGSGYPALMWVEYMEAAMDGKEKIDFDGPSNRTSSQTKKTGSDDSRRGESSAPKASSSVQPSQSAAPGPAVSESASAPAEEPTAGNSAPPKEPTAAATGGPTSAPSASAPEPPAAREESEAQDD